MHNLGKFMSYARHLDQNFILEQWERVKRWRNGCINFKSFGEDCPNLLDYYLAFFINSYHFKNWLECWLKNDHKNDLVEQLEQDFKDKKYLGVLRDICNGSKHFNLTNPSVGEKYSTPLSYDPRGCKFQICIGDQQMYLDDLVKDVFEYWIKFMEINKLNKLKKKLNFRISLSSSDKVKKE